MLFFVCTRAVASRKIDKLYNHSHRDMTNELTTRLIRQALTSRVLSTCTLCSQAIIRPNVREYSIKEGLTVGVATVNLAQCRRILDGSTGLLPLI